MTLAETLAEISGAENVFTEASQLEEYSEDMAGYTADAGGRGEAGSEAEVRR